MEVASHLGGRSSEPFFKMGTLNPENHPKQEFDDSGYVQEGKFRFSHYFRVILAKLRQN